MDILPAIDLRGGKVVRLARGDYGAQTVYSGDPAAVAQKLVEAGAQWIHVVDLDAARTGRPTNTAAVRAVRRAVNVNIQLGGGARNEQTIVAMLDEGVNRVVVGSAALTDWPWFEKLLHLKGFTNRLAMGLDAREGRLAVHGWTEQTDKTPVEMARQVAGSGLGAIIYTDIARDGMLAGVNFEATKELVLASDVPIIASGGVSSLEDIRRCRLVGCSGAIVGKAYYEGKIDLTQAIAEAGEAAP